MLSKGNRWEGGKGDGEEKRGGQYTANLGTEWTGTRATTQRRDFQVSELSEGRVLGSEDRDFQAAKGDVKRG